MVIGLLRKTFFTPLFVSTGLIIIQGCQESTYRDLGQGRVISFPAFSMGEDLQSIHYLDYIQDVEVYWLQDSVLIGKVDKIVKSSGYLYLLNVDGQTVHIHDTTGIFLNRIENYGRGANEYSQLVDITVAPESGDLQLLSRLDRKLLTYNPTGDELLSVKRLPKSFFTLVHDQSGYVGYSGNYRESPHAKDIWVLNDDLSIASGHFEIDPGFKGVYSSGIRSFSTFGETIHLVKPMDYNVYSMRGRAVKTEYTFDFGAMNWPADKNTIAKIDAMDLFEKSRYVRSIGMFQENDNFITIKFVANGKTVLGVYDKRDGSATLADLSPNRKKYPLSFGRVLGMDEHEILALVEATDVKKMLDGKDAYNDFESMYPEQIKRLRARLAGIQIDDMSNPFLLVYKTK